MADNTLGDRIRGRREARREEALADLKAHIDAQFDALHARLDEQRENPRP
jgi:hypothetical protein